MQRYRTTGRSMSKPNRDKALNRIERELRQISGAAPRPYPFNWDPVRDPLWQQLMQKLREQWQT